MTKERNALRAGLFIVITVLLIVGIVVSIKGGARFAEPRQERTAAFKLSDDLGGLRAGDEVRVGGHKAGTVKSIEVAGLDGPDPRLLVTFTLPVKYVLRADARVGVQTTLTGSSVLNVESLGTGAALAGGQQLVGRPDPKAALFAGLGGAGEDIGAVARDVRYNTLPKVNAAVDTYKKTGEAATELVQHVRSKVDPMEAKYNDVAHKTGDMMVSVKDMIGPSTKDFHGTMADLHQITGDVKTRLPGMLDKLQASVDGAEKALVDARETMANAKDATASLKSLIAGNRGKLDDMLGSVKTTGDNLKAASAEIRRSPWRLLYQPKQDELNNLNLYDSARQFAEGANDLNDAAQALRDAIDSGEKDPEKIQKMITRLEKSFGEFRTVEEKLWRGVKE